MKNSALTTRSLSVLLTLAVILISFLVLKFDPSGNSTGFLKEQIDFTQTNNAPQRHAHLVSLIATLLLGISGLYLNYSRKLSGRIPPLAGKLYQGIARPSLFLILPLAALCFWVNSKVGRDPWVLSLGLGWILFFLPRFCPRLKTWRGGYTIMNTVAGLMVAAPLAAMLLMPIYLGSYSSSQDLHTGCILGIANQIGGGLVPGVDIWSGYGIFFQFLLGIFQRTFGFFDIAQQFQVVIVIQGLYVLLMVLSWRMWNKRHPLYILLPLLLLLPFLYNYANIPLLNHSGIRFFNFAIIPFILILSQKISARPASLILGSACGIAFLINPETAIALGVGILAYIITQDPFHDWKGIALAALNWGASLAITFLVFQGVLQVAFGPGAYYFPLTKISRFSGGFAGLPLYFDPPIILFFVHAVYIALRSAILWGKRPLSKRQRARLAFAVTLLIWLAYYAARPHSMHLQTFYPLYSFFLIDMLDIRRIRLYWKQRPIPWRTALLPLPLVLVLIIVLPLAGESWNRSTKIGRAHV